MSEGPKSPCPVHGSAGASVELAGELAFSAPHPMGCPEVQGLCACPHLSWKGWGISVPAFNRF